MELHPLGPPVLAALRALHPSSEGQLPPDLASVRAFPFRVRMVARIAALRLSLTDISHYRTRRHIVARCRHSARIPSTSAARVRTAGYVPTRPERLTVAEHRTLAALASSLVAST